MSPGLQVLRVFVVVPVWNIPAQIICISCNEYSQKASLPNKDAAIDLEFVFLLLYFCPVRQSPRRVIHSPPNVVG